jgi:CCR4-NOT transcription complex subunit 1
MIAEAVDQSIYEILPPVVDRSVTIALITTRELVLKDFAYDSNPNKILNAANLIVQNLAGSLALVTCREPLKMQLTTNLKKTITLHMPGTMQTLTFDSPNIPVLTENLINDLANLASKDNLDLGCKMIKKAVI